MKSIRLSVMALLLAVSATLVFGQAEQVKSKAKNLKKQVEGQQTNRIDKSTPPPAK